MLVLISLFEIKAQSNINFNKFQNVFEPHVHKNDWAKHLRESKNEAQFLFSFLFIFYKEVFSSQDVDSCVFTPSCSVYAIESVSKNGAIIGVLDAFDRLTRCNPGKKDCPINPQTGKYSDPVK